MAGSSATTVAVIGGGASGLAAAKCLLEAGLRPTVFEQSPHIGGVWSFDETLPAGGSPAYRSLHTNTPKQITAFSDFPFPDDLPDFPSHAEVISYLSAYAERFGVWEHIRRETHVATVVPAAGGGWTVQVACQSGAQIDRFDAVFVCSGMFGEPRLPDIPGLRSFPGLLLHSRAYTAADPFAGRRVLVVGTGSSGTDIAVETGQVAQQVWLSGRNDAWAVAAGTLGGPASWGTRLGRHLRLRLGLEARRSNGDSVRPDAPFVLQPDRLILNDRLRETIGAGAVRPRPGIARVDGATVRFTDGTSVEVDTIICATGYALRFPFLNETIFRVTPAGLNLYRVVLHPDQPTLAFIGMSRATGAIMPLAEMQARWAAQVLRGTVNLPPAAAMQAGIDARRRFIAARGGNPFRIEFEPYMDTLASEIGALPQLRRHPRLWRVLLAGKPVAARYRLDGPGRAADAPRILLAAHRPEQPPGPPAVIPGAVHDSRVAARHEKDRPSPDNPMEQRHDKHIAYEPSAE
jgi:dimethylaniline monooxygenase (N-oxide forming)